MKTYFLFCNYFNISPLPLIPFVICNFFEFLSRSVKAFSTLLNYKSSLKRFALYNGYSDEPLSDFVIVLSLRALKRELSTLPVQKLPISPGMLLQFVEYLDLSIPVHATLWACYLIAFFGFLRKSNLVPPTPQDFSPEKHLTRGNISVLDECLCYHHELE